MKKIIALLPFLLIGMLTQAQGWTQIQKSDALHRDTDSRYGATIDISGNEAVIGTFSEDTDQDGLNDLSEAGAVYVLNFDENTGTWQATQKLVAEPRENSEFFGVDAAIDGNYMIVGAKSSDLDENGANSILDGGAAYFFEKINDEWILAQKVVASDRAEFNFFGSTVTISGEYALVVASNNSTDENNSNVQNNAGAGYIFHRDGAGVWSQTQKIVASDRAASDFFGNAADMDGENIVIAAYNESEDSAGANTLNQAGSAYVFNLNPNDQWIEVDKITATDRGQMDWFGISVGISGDQIVIGARQEDEDEVGANMMTSAGSAYVFENVGSNVWSQSQKLVSSDRADNDLFGYSVAIFEDKIIVGARSEDEDTEGINTVNKAGSAYVFEKNNGVDWIESQKLIANDRHDNDYLGASVAIENGLVMIGSRGNDTDQNDENNLNNAGAVYVYTSCITVVTDIPLSICQGDSVLIGDAYQSQTGDYIVSTMDSLGCISSLNYQLLVNDYTVSNIDIESCQGETVTIEGDVYTEDSEFLLVGEGECADSTYYNLIFHPSPTLFVDGTICLGDSVEIEGSYYSEDIDFISQNDTTQFGCPSYIHYSLALFTPQDVQVTNDLCEGDTILINEQVITENGNYPVPDQDWVGCDIIVTHIVTFHTPEDTNVTDVLCEGETIEIDGVIITQNGEYVASEEGDWGCISSVTHTVTFNPVPSIDLGVDLEICDTLDYFLDAGAGHDEYLWSDNSTNQTLEITESGVYTVMVTDLNCSTSDEIQITVYTCTGIDELSISQIQVYPNPTIGTIYFENLNSKFDKFIIYNENGQVVKESVINNLTAIDVKQLSSGLYVIDFIGKDFSQKARFIKK